MARYENLFRDEIIPSTFGAGYGGFTGLNPFWSSKYGMAVRSWQNNWEDLTTYFAFSAEIRRLIYTTNSVEGYHRQLRKVIKNKGSFPTSQAVRKLFYPATMDIEKKWTKPISNWPLILNQLAIRFDGRLPS